MAANMDAHLHVVHVAQTAVADAPVHLHKQRLIAGIVIEVAVRETAARHAQLCAHLVVVVVAQLLLHELILMKMVKMAHVELAVVKYVLMELPEGLVDALVVVIPFVLTVIVEVRAHLVVARVDVTHHAQTTAVIHAEMDAILVVEMRVANHVVVHAGNPILVNMELGLRRVMDAHQSADFHVNQLAKIHVKMRAKKRAVVPVPVPAKMNALVLA